jgi:uncharacterized cupin superfamily protein
VSELPVIRRIVTGEDEEGRSIFALVEEVVPRRLRETASWPVWGVDGEVMLPHPGTSEYEPTSFPPPEGGFRVAVSSMPAGFSSAEPAVEEAAATAQHSGHPRRHVIDPATGMHQTDTVDVVVILSGEIVLEQDDGAEVTLRRGDVLVQNGAVHAWRNRSDEPCVAAFVNIAAKRRPGPAGNRWEQR